MAAWRLLLAAVLGYLLGNIQTGLIVGLVSRKIDLRTKGSGSTGTTNALRTLGLPSAIITFLGDLLKGLVASLLGAKIAGPNGQLLAALAVILGHIWPVFFGFRGGKGVATTVGALFVMYPTLGMVCVPLSIVLIAITRYVSLGNMIGMLVYGVWVAILSWRAQDYVALVIGILIPAIVIFAHRQNIRRLLNGTENKLGSRPKQKP